MRKYFFALTGVLACIFLMSQNAMANFIAFESLPMSTSSHVSHHTSGGPVLADDFSTTIAGSIAGIEWWGAAPRSGSGTDSWEATFHFDALGEPAATGAFGGISQHILEATGTDLDGDGIYHYVAAWPPADLFILANTTYWFSIANASGGSWTWANGAPPTIGSELWDAAVSAGAPGSPHFGPWSALDDTNFSFNIILAPEPGVVALLGLGLITVVTILRRRYDMA